MTKIELTDADYLADERQQRIHDCEARIIVVEVGRGGGKSRCCYWKCMQLIEELKKQVRPPTMVPRIHMWVLAPTYDQAGQAWLEVKRFTPQQLWATEPNESEKKMWLYGDVLIEVKSGHDPGSLQTPSLDILWITEADNVQDAAYYNISPALARAGRAGYIIAEGRPVRAHSWFEKLGKLGQDGKHPDIAYFHWTSLVSPFADQERIQLDREIMPDKRWRMEYLAERGESERAAFHNVKGCIKGEIEEPIEGHAYVIGFDVGRTDHPSIFIIMDTNRRRVTNYRVVTGRTLVLQKETTIDLAKRWNAAPVFMDAGGIGFGLLDELRASGQVEVKGIQFGGAAKDRHNPGINMKEKMYTDLIVAIERETISYPNIPELITQLEAIELKGENEGFGHEPFQPPPGYKDDYVAALALAVYGCHAPAGVAPGAKVITGYY